MGEQKIWDRKRSSMVGLNRLLRGLLNPEGFGVVERWIGEALIEGSGLWIHYGSLVNSASPFATIEQVPHLLNLP